MFRLLKNPKVRVALSMGEAFSFGLLIFGGLRESVGPSGVLLIILAAMPLLAVGFYLQNTAISRYMERAEKA